MASFFVEPPPQPVRIIEAKIIAPQIVINFFRTFFVLIFVIRLAFQSNPVFLEWFLNSTLINIFLSGIKCLSRTVEVFLRRFSCLSAVLLFKLAHNGQHLAAVFFFGGFKSTALSVRTKGYRKHCPLLPHVNPQKITWSAICKLLHWVFYSFINFIVIISVSFVTLNLQIFSHIKFIGKLHSVPKNKQLILIHKISFVSLPIQVQPRLDNSGS